LDLIIEKAYKREKIMKSIRKILLLLFITLLLSSCGAIPTLPPMDSTITIGTLIITDIPRQAVTSEPGTPIADLPSATPEAISTDVPPSVTPFSTQVPSETPEPTAADPASPTPENTQEPTSTAMPTGTATSTPTDMPTATFTPQPTFTATPAPYQLQLMNPYYLSNFTHPELGCDWLGIAGQIFSSGGQVQLDVLIKVGGELNGNPVEEEMTMPLADSDIDLAYGPGGYELTLAFSPVDTESTAWVQLFSLGGDTLSEKIYLTTFADCQKNLILMNFSER
jgi:hypothetical protein